MIKPVGRFLGTTVLSFAWAACACAQDPPAVGAALASSLPVDTTSWPWIAVGGLIVTLGAIALVSRRRMPFGKSS
jgi:hypothetical protein